MPAVLQNALAPITESRLAERAGAGLARTSDQARARAALRQQLIAPVIRARDGGLSVRNAALLVFTQLQAGNAEPPLLAAVTRCKVSAASLERWTREYLEGGLQALAPKHCGRVRKDYGWETRAIALYQQPVQPSFSTVAFWLRQEGYETARDHRVRGYLQALPSNLTETAPKRVGRHFYDQNIRPHRRRDLSTIEAGEVWQGDGHCCDVYVQHPLTGQHYRPELTVWIDLRSNYIVGWWLSESESAVTTLFSLSAAIREHDHVPVWIHTDPGSGFKNKMMGDEALGFYSRIGATHMASLPGNAKSKGLVEGWFRWFEERCGKRFESFCGHCRTDDLLARLETKIRRGEITIPTFAQYADAVRDYVALYNRTPQPGSQTLQGLAPAQVWADLKRNPLHVSPELLTRPQRKCTVRRWQVRLFNRFYKHADLAGYERREVAVEYDIHQPNEVWIRDGKQRLVCAALLVGQTPFARESIAADAREKSRLAKVARHTRAIDEIDARARMAITGTAARFVESVAGADELVPERIESLRQEEIENAAAVEETADERFVRAMQLESSDQLNAADAQWLEIYQTSAEYHSRRALHEEFAAPRSRTSSVPGSVHNLVHLQAAGEPEVEAEEKGPADTGPSIQHQQEFES